MARGGDAGGLRWQQSVAEARALRADYRQLGQDLVATKEQLAGRDGLLLEKLECVRELHKKVARPREHAVDAEVFAQLTEVGLEKIKRGQAANQGRMPADLVAALRLLFVPDALAAGSGRGGLSLGAFDWQSLGGEASRLHRTATGVQCMLGALDAEAKVRKAVAARQARAPLAPEERPDKLRGLAEEEGDAKQETDRNYEHMWRALKARGFGASAALPLAQLVVNHASFSQTVENIFTLSFLVRDQRVRLAADAERGLLVTPVSDEARARAQASGQVKANQFMLHFTQADWELMRRLVDRRDAVMPHRAPASAAAGGAGAGAGAGSSRAAAAAAAAAGGVGGRPSKRPRQ